MAGIILNGEQVNHVIKALKKTLQNEGYLSLWLNDLECALTAKGGSAAALDQSINIFMFKLLRERLRSEPDQIKSVDNLEHTYTQKTTFVKRQKSIDPQAGRMIDQKRKEYLKALRAYLPYLDDKKDEKLKRLLQKKLKRLGG